MPVGTVVLEANLGGGALITAGMAADDGRQDFAVSDRIDSPRNKGCHELIKKDFKLCDSASQIVLVTIERRRIIELLMEGRWWSHSGNRPFDRSLGCWLKTDTHYP